jgi:hypothetical protein
MDCHRNMSTGGRLRNKAATRGAVAAAIAIVLLGYWSNSYSRPRCSLATANWLAKPFVGSKVVYCLGWKAPADPALLFGPETTIHTGLSPGQRREGTPILTMGSPQGHFPFIVSQDWSWSTGPLRGEQGKSSYLCLFGRIVWHRCPATWYF